MGVSASTDPTISSMSPSTPLSEDEWIQILKEESEHAPKPAYEQSTIWMGGIFVFVLAMIWPPLILVGTYILSVFLPYAFRTNDSGESRRKLMHQCEKTDTLSASRCELPNDVYMENGYWTNSRGSLLYYTILTPKVAGNTTDATSNNKKIKAILCHCHGFGDTPTFTKRRELATLAQKGIAVLMVDGEGHGRSDGPVALLSDWNAYANDLHSFFSEMTTKKFPGIKLFLFGESMGGAAAYTIIKAHPDVYSGVNLLAPMCKIGEGMQPSEWVERVGRLIAGPTGTTTTIGYLPIAPVPGNLRMLTYRLARKRALTARSPAQFARRPRLATGRELLNATKSISDSLKDFSAPFLVQHGKADCVTDPKLSQALYDECCSKDKTIRLYDDMWHGLTSGESDEDVAKVYQDSIQWILERAS